MQPYRVFRTIFVLYDYTRLSVCLYITEPLALSFWQQHYQSQVPYTDAREVLPPDLAQLPQICEDPPTEAVCQHSQVLSQGFALAVLH